jgi:Rrf2 family transcriptional regulator, cysteine metabolism repressor
MQLSTKARYAVRAMIELAVNYGKGPTLLKEIASRQEISEKYLEQLMGPLRAAGLIYTLRGNKGGYILGKDPREVTVYCVVSVVEGSLAPVPCVDKAEICHRAPFCVSRNVWSDLKEKIIANLESVNLAELAAKQEQQNMESLV